MLESCIKIVMNQYKMKFRSKVIRYVLKDKLHNLPNNAKLLKGGSIKLRRLGRVRAEFDFYWIIKNGNIYSRLVGEL